MVGQGLKQAHFFLAELVRMPHRNGKSAQGPITEQQGGAGLRDHALGTVPITIHHARILPQIGNHDSRPGRHDPAHDPLADTEPRDAGQGGNGPGVGPEGQRLAVLVHEPEPRHAGAEELDGRLDHPLQDFLDAQRGGQGPGQLAQGLEALSPACGRLVELGVVERHGRLAGQRAQEADLGEGGRMGLPPVHGQDAIRLVLDEDGNRQHSPVAFAADEGAGLIVQDDGGVVQDVRGPGRGPVADGLPRCPLARAHTQRLDELRRQADAPLVRQDAGGRIQLEDPGRPHAQQRPGPLDDQVQDALHLERGAHEPADLEEGLVLGGAPRSLVVESGVFDRDGRLGSEGDEKLQFLLGRAMQPPGQDREHSEEAVLEEEGHADERHVAFPPHPLHVDGPRVFDHPLDHQRLPRLRHLPRQPLAHREDGPPPSEGRSGYSAFHPQDKAVLLGDPEPHRRVRDEAGGGLNDAVQHLAEVQAGGHRLGQAHEALEPLALFPRLDEQRRPLHRHADLVGDGLHELHLFGAELAGARGDEGHHAPHLALDRNGQGELRLEPAGRHGRACGPDGFAELRALDGSHLHPLRRLRRQSALGDQRERFAPLLQLVEGRDVHLRDPPHDLEGLFGSRDEVDRSVDRESDGVERFELPVPVPDLHAPALERVAHLVEGPGHVAQLGLPPERNGNARIEVARRHAPRALAQRLDGLEHAPGQDPGGREGGRGREEHEARHPRPEEPLGRASIGVGSQQPERPVGPAADRAHEVRGPPHFHAAHRRGVGPPDARDAAGERRIDGLPAGQKDELHGERVRAEPPADRLEPPAHHDSPEGAPLVHHRRGRQEQRHAGHDADRGHGVDRAGREAQGRSIGRGGNPDERSPPLVHDDDQVGDPVQRQRQHPGRRGPGERRPVALHDPLNDRGVAREEPGLPPEVLEAARHEGRDGADRSLEGGFGGLGEPVGDGRNAHRRQDEERDEHRGQRREKNSRRPAHEGRPSARP